MAASCLRDIVAASLTLGSNLHITSQLVFNEIDWLIREVIQLQFATSCELINNHTSQE